MLSFNSAEPPDWQSPQVRKLLAATTGELVKQGMNGKQARNQARRAIVQTAIHLRSVALQHERPLPARLRIVAIGSEQRRQ